MDGVLLGFSVVAVLTLVGAATAAFARTRASLIQDGLTPLVYYITNPCLMVVLVSQTDLQLVAGLYTPLALLIATLTAAIFVLFGLFAKRSAPAIAMGAMSASYVNAGNIGVPVALYIVGTTAPVVSVLLAQLLVLAPTYLTIFGLIARKSSSKSAEPGTSPRSRLATILGSMFNPTTTGVLIGALISWTEWHLPPVLWEPLLMVGEASIPLMLIVFGMALWQERPFRSRAQLPDSVLATLCKAIIMPLIAWLLAGPIAGLEGLELLGVVTMAALPTAQNVFIFGYQHGMPTSVSKDVTFASSFLALPVTLFAAWILTT